MRRVWIEMSMFMIAASTAESPSMRRVWIEIVLLRLATLWEPSPSMRRVWIEIQSHSMEIFPTPVTLHAEGVD